MGKNKGRGGGSSARVEQSGAAGQATTANSSLVQQPTPNPPSLPSAVDNNREEKPRNEVMASRKDKKAAKAERAAKAQAKKAVECEVNELTAAVDGNAGPANAAADCSGRATVTTEGTSRDEMVAQQKALAIAARAAKAKERVTETENIEKIASELGGMRVDGTEKSKDYVLAARQAKAAAKAERVAKAKMNQEQQKSALKTQAAPHASTTSEKGVRFGMASSQSEENLLIAEKHAAEDNVKIADPTNNFVSELHPSLLPLYDLAESSKLEGIDDLCFRFLLAAKEFITDSAKQARGDTPLGLQLDKALKAQLSTLSAGRYPLPFALSNLVKLLLKEIVAVGNPQERTGKAKSAEDVIDWLEEAVKSNFSLAHSAISQHLAAKIRAATKIVTYDWCPVVSRVLEDAVSRKEVDEICVLDAVKGGPGLRHMENLSSHTGYVEYGDLTAAGSVFCQGALVLLGCSAVFSSGRVVVSRGAFQLALIARASNVPLLVLAPTYKFYDKAQWQEGRQALLGRQSLEALPPDLVTAIVTEIRLLPPSSAPAVLKAKALDDTS